MPRLAASAKANFGEAADVGLLKRAKMTSFSDLGWVPVAKSQMKRLMQAAGSVAATGRKAKSESSLADLFPLEFERTEEIAIALSPMIPAASKIPDPLTKAVVPIAAPLRVPPRPRPVPTLDAVRPMLVPNRATAELTAQAVRARARYTLGFMLI